MEVCYCDRCGKEIEINKFDFSDDGKKYNIALDGGEAGTIQKDIPCFDGDIMYLCKNCFSEVTNDIIKFRKEHSNNKLYYIRKLNNETLEYSYFDRFYINQFGDNSTIPNYSKILLEAMFYRTIESAELDIKEIERISNDDVIVMEYKIPSYVDGPIDEGDIGQPYYNYPMWAIRATIHKEVYGNVFESVKFYDPLTKKWFDHNIDNYGPSSVQYLLKQTEYPWIISDMEKKIKDLPINDKIRFEPILFCSFIPAHVSMDWLNKKSK